MIGCCIYQKCQFFCLLLCKISNGLLFEMQLYFFLKCHQHSESMHVYLCMVVRAQMQYDVTLESSFLHVFLPIHVGNFLFWRLPKIFLAWKIHSLFYCTWTMARILTSRSLGLGSILIVGNSFPSSVHPSRLVQPCEHYIYKIKAFIHCMICLLTKCLRYSHSTLFMSLQYSAVTEAHQHNQILYTVCEQSESFHVKRTLMYTNTEEKLWR